MDYNNLSMNNEFENAGKKSGFSTASLIIAVLPLWILLLIVLFCCIILYSGVLPTDYADVVFIPIFMVMILIPVSIFTNLLSVILGIIGLLKSKKTVFAWAGIVIAVLELLTVLWLFHPMLYSMLLGNSK